MTGAGRFLYGIALGVSLGIIGSKLLGAASSAPQRQSARNGGARAAPRTAVKARQRQKVAAR